MWESRDLCAESALVTLPFCNLRICAFRWLYRTVESLNNFFRMSQETLVSIQSADTLKSISFKVAWRDCLVWTLPRERLRIP
jgi:hypothetical protein